MDNSLGAVFSRESYLISSESIDTSRRSHHHNFVDLVSDRLIMQNPISDPKTGAWRRPQTSADLPQPSTSGPASSKQGKKWVPLPTGGPPRDAEEGDLPRVIDGAGDGVQVGGGSEVDDLAAELRELMVADEEVELDEDTAKSNQQLQEDELLAVESIYGDNVSILDSRAGSPIVQIHIDIDSGEYTVSANLKSSRDGSTTHGDSDGFHYSFKVRYLPPIVLTCLLPKSYPSHSPPSFSITVQWLSSHRISLLCSMLDSLWAEQPGQEIIYRWVGWLQCSSLSYIGFQDEIALGPYGYSGNKDRRAISRSFSPEVDIPSIKNYNDERCREEFLTSLHECCICFSEYAGSDFVRLPCQHFFCLKCMKTYSDIQVKEDVAYCPRCETACIEDDDQHAQCSKCYFSFCTLCRERRHVGVACMTPELRLKVLQERQSSSHLQDNQRRKEREMINELLSVKEIMRDAKQCPSCKMAISKIEGCNKMVCQNCGQYFCYKCNKAIDGYDHFSGGCELFPQAMVDAWDQDVRMNNRQLVAQAQAEMFPDHGLVCPTCRQYNAKIGNNNHMFCWACQTYYCYLCKKVVKRGSQHFGPKGCRQHTAG
ncbi:hypothetical protein MLD38_036441 [Melastoma candidum]|uniref:Uncharacterized protein n=1 Tax=Melastoma candidum TaxID=119954 RepID=A0ACB9LJW8_9MYRT|nr:hypothetical protein MLD38_036441 [Melastoma candidum]